MLVINEKSSKRELIIQCTILCIEKYGIENFSIRTVAREAECAIGLVNLHFGTKDALLAEVYCAYIANFEYDIICIVESLYLSPSQKLKNIVQVYFGAEEKLELQLNAWIAFWVLARTHNSLKKSREKHNKILRECLTKIFSERKALKHSPQMQAMEFIALMDGLWLEMGLNNQTLKLSDAIKIINAWIDKNNINREKNNEKNNDESICCSHNGYD